MAIYHDPQAPKGRVVFGGEAFIDGKTADIEPGPETLNLFKAAGITDLVTDNTRYKESAEPEAEISKPVSETVSKKK